MEVIERLEVTVRQFFSEGMDVIVLLLLVVLHLFQILQLIVQLFVLFLAFLLEQLFQFFALLFSHFVTSLQLLRGRHIFWYPWSLNNVVFLVSPEVVFLKLLIQSLRAVPIWR